MTQKEKIIATAYTGYMFVGDFAPVHEYVEKKLGRPVYTHEFADKVFQIDLHEAVKPDFMAMIKKGDRK